MKTKKKIVTLLTALVTLALLSSCEEKEDYSHIVFRNYLTYEINRATNLLDAAVEGTGEGEYQTGSKQTYQEVIDEASLVDENKSATQQEIDLVYESLLQADEDFSDRMVPFRSAFNELIDYGEVVLANTEEGDSEGNVKPGNKAILREAVDEAKALVSLEGLTQRMLDQGTAELNNAIYYFNGEIIGRATTYLVNPGFEIPGYETEDFKEVDGWRLFGIVEDWAPLASVAELETAPEGEFVAKIGSYTQGLYQPVEEMIQPNAEYTLEFDVSLLTNNSDWQGKRYPAILLARLFVFEEKTGDYNFLTVLSESYDTLGIDPGAFQHMSQSVTIGAVSESIGKKVAIDFVQRHTWNAADPIWAESFVAIDNVILYRKL